MRLYKVLGVLGATIAYPFMALSIAYSPWFSFFDNALSDLGNTVTNGSAAWIYNVGLIVSGLLVASFAVVTSLRHLSWKYLSWTPLLAAAGIDLSLVGFFPVNAGRIHGVVSTMLFALMLVVMLVYSYCSWPLDSPRTGAIALGFSIASAVIWYVSWPWRGVAIQETCASVMTTVWLIVVSLRGI